MFLDILQKKVSKKSAPSKGLTRTIEDRIRWDKRISNSDVTIRAVDGAVTIAGVVDAPSKKLAAEEVVRATLGVETVKNLIVVQFQPHRSDSHLRAAIFESLAMFKLMPGDSIAVSVTSGRVRLTGNVSTKDAKAFASGAVWELSGVLDCANEIEIEMPIRDARAQFRFAAPILKTRHLERMLTC